MSPARGPCVISGCAGDPTAPGGARGLCPRCYRRQRRSELGEGRPPDQVRRRLERPVQVRLDVEAYVLALVDALAAREGVERAEWVRRAIAERCNRLTPGGEWIGPMPEDG